MKSRKRRVSPSEKGSEQSCEEWRGFLLTERDDVTTALRRLCKTANRVLFVVKDGRLVASLTDGDIRRFLLDGGQTGALAIDAAHKSPRFLFSTERRLAESFLVENDLDAVPIVDEDRTVLDVVTRRSTVDVDSVTIREMQCVDLAMGLEFFDQMAGDTRAMFNRGDENRLRLIEHLNSPHDSRQIHFAAVAKGGDGTEIMVGYVFLWDIDKKIPWLGIAVREGWKGHHLGRRLIDHVDAWAKPKGYGGLMLTSVPANVRAHSLYERMGFKYHGVYPDGELLYVKRYAI